MRIRLVIFLIITMLCLNLRAQLVDSIQGEITTLRGLRVHGQSEKVSVGAVAPTQQLNTKMLSAIPAVQISDVLKLFSGVVIKDYGGVGGMKTVSVRGFGSQHTAVAYDGIVVADGQTGQIDLSRFSLQNIGSLELITGPTYSGCQSARITGAASVLQLRTLVPQLSNSCLPLHLDVRFTGGSFGLVNPSLHLENVLKNKTDKSAIQIFSVLNINYLQSKGDYPFTIYYGGANDSISQERRANSDVKTFTVEENLQFLMGRRGDLCAKFYYYQSERGLPGAVVFYRAGEGQRLYDLNTFGQMSYQMRRHSKWDYRMLAKFNFYRQRYYDPSYLNAVGFLDNRYWQRGAYLSNAVEFRPHKLVAISCANDLIFGNMNANIADFCTPSRLQILTVMTASLKHRQVEALVRVLHTGVLNWVKNGAAGENLSNFSPSASISVQPLPTVDWHIRAFYQNVYRIPTFNDLYYNEVGNVKLLPENAQQLNLGTTIGKQLDFVPPDDSAVKWHQKQWALTFSADGYYNRVKNKIVAVPSKNLFVWTMLNYGKVEMCGIDVSTSVSYTFVYSNLYSFHLSGNYSLQRAVDKSDANAKTYGHQIPYTPLHSGAVSASVKFLSNFEFCYTLVAAGKRYALRQNVETNELPPYCDHSLSFSYEYPLYQKNKKACWTQYRFGAKVEVLNLANKHYEVVRNYPMQGRSFRFSTWVKF